LCWYLMLTGGEYLFDNDQDFEKLSNAK